MNMIWISQQSYKRLFLLAVCLQYLDFEVYSLRFESFKHKVQNLVSYNLNAKQANKTQTKQAYILHNVSMGSIH